MRHEMHHEKRAFGGAAARAKGGPVEERMAELHADSKEGKDDEKYDGKGSDVEKESEVDGYGGHKRGGHVKKAAGGAVARKRGGKVHHGSMPMHVEGKHPAHRMDRPGRKRGGGVGADTSPMTAAAKLTAPPGSHYQTKTDKSDD